MQTVEIHARSILNPTSGFLKEGFTHTINLQRGCPLGNSVCGAFCYAKANIYHTAGRRWGSFLDIKMGFLEAYRRDYDKIKRPREGNPQPLRIFMSSVTEPYPPQERLTRRTRALLQEMLDRPPDLLNIQSHTPLVVDDLSLLQQLKERCKLQVNVTVETDIAVLPRELPQHVYSPQARIDALSQLRLGGICAVGVVSPLLPLRDPLGFARSLERACDRVILDHYLIGDGSHNGLRTKRIGFPELMTRAGFEEWNHLEALAGVERIFRQVFSDQRRVTISRAGFNNA